MKPEPGQGIGWGRKETKIVLEKTGWSYQVSFGGSSG
jgi:hypothetical protein